MERFLKKLAARSADLYAAPLTVAFLGDSVTQGCFEVYATGPDTLETVYDSPAGYAQALQSVFAGICPRLPLNILNCGISGDNAPRGAQRLQRDVLDHRPDLVVVSFGLNDSCQGMEKLSQYTDALEDIFTRLRQADVEAILLTPNMMCRYTDPRLADPLLRGIAKDAAQVQNSGVLDAYMQAACETARRCGAAVCDCYADWKRMDAVGIDTTALLSNHINHPTRALHWLFAWRLFETILQG